MKKTKPHFHVTAGLIWREGNLLITRRPRGSHLAGYWEFPGGKQEGNESLPECLEREIKEELGVSVRTGQHLLEVDYAYETKSITLHLFRCAIVDGEPQPLGCDEMKWVSPGDLSQHLLPPPDLLVLPHLKKWFRNETPAPER